MLPLWSKTILIIQKVRQFWYCSMMRTSGRFMWSGEDQYIHEGEYVAEAEVELMETDDDWSPHLSLDDVYELDDVRDALRRGDPKAAARQARVFSLQPVAINTSPKADLSF